MSAVSKIAKLIADHAEEVKNTLSGNERIKNRANSYKKVVKSGLLSSFPILKKDPQNVTMTDMLNSGVGVVPATFIGPKSRIWDADAAAKATKLLDEGIDPAKVWKEHLIGRMPDGKLFGEIDDSAAHFTDAAFENRMSGDDFTPPMPLKDAIDHPDLHKAYDLGDYSIAFKYSLPNGASGNFSNKTLNVERYGVDPWSTTMHENQHVIQDIEGWAKGGSPSMFKQGDGLSADDSYRRLTGEAQARATQDRLKMNMQQRRDNYPLGAGLLSDIPLDQLIYRYGNKESQQ